MNLKRLEEALALDNLTPELSVDDSKDLSGGYCSDLLSDVLAHAPSVIRPRPASVMHMERMRAGRRREIS